MTGDESLGVITCRRSIRKLIKAQLHPHLELNTIVGPPPDKDEFDLQEYSTTLRTLGIPPYPQLKPIGLFSGVSGSSTLGTVDPPGIPSASVSPPAAPAPSPASRILGPAPWSTYQQDPNRPPPDADEEDGDAHISAHIAEAMSKLEIKDMSWRFHGKASGAHLMRVISDLKFGEGSPRMFEILSAKKRPEYWMVPEWEIVIAQEGVNPIDWSIWPEVELDRTLIDSYFTHVNHYLPLLNKVVFDKHYNSGLYRTNHEFAKICWMVFANGARFIDDDRVYWPADLAMSEEGKQRLLTDADGTKRYSAGWKYIRALLRMGRSIVAVPSLYDFQTQVLLCAFLNGSAIPHMTWLLSGYGLRSAQELGIHVRSTLLHADPTERALYNRAFWCLYHIDRLNCAAIGRSVALQDTDFDADYPIAVDDEYWETGDRATDFAQPPDAGLPSVSAFIHMLKLDHVIGAALKTIYAVNKSPEQRADPAAQREVVVELDSALNSWADAVPDDLRWDPSRSNQAQFQQSAALYAQYYYCQILIHRPFIPTPRNPNTVGLPSLAICSNASRSICNILDAALRRGRQYGLLPGRILDVSFLVPAYVAAIILLVALYAGKMQPAERQRTINDIQKCLAAIKDMELTWRLAGKLTDMLSNLLKEDDGVAGAGTGAGMGMGKPGCHLVSGAGARAGATLPQGQKRPHHDESSYQQDQAISAVPPTGQYPTSSSSSARTGHQQSHPPIQIPQALPPTAPSTPPFLWGWNNNAGNGVANGANASGGGGGTGPIFPGMAPPPNSSAHNIDIHNTATTNPNPNPNVNGNVGTVPNVDGGIMTMDSFFDTAVFGLPTLGLGDPSGNNGMGMGMGMSNGMNGGGGFGAGEEDLWQQLFGTYP